MLERCYKDATGVLERFYKGATEVSQRCYRSVKYMLQRYCKDVEGVQRVLQRSYGRVTEVLQRCYTNVTKLTSCRHVVPADLHVQCRDRGAVAKHLHKWRCDVGRPEGHYTIGVTTVDNTCV
jgi:hypothetical protein